MHCTCQKLGKNVCVRGNESDRGEGYFGEYFPRKNEKRGPKLCFATTEIYFQDTFDEICFSSCFKILKQLFQGRFLNLVI